MAALILSRGQADFLRRLHHFRLGREALLLLALLTLVALAHGVNMFHFPYYENDEGAYVSQAQSFIEHGRLAPYTYWYDHAPAGWILIAIWAKLTGGFFTFGFSINSGRVLMLLLHLASSIAMYLVVRRLTGKPWAALLAVAAFSFGPNGIYFQRRVLLDNIAVFWIMLSILALTYSRQRLSRVIASSLFLALALLTKETVLFLVPALWIGAIFSVSRAQRVLAAFLFPTICGAVGSIYFLYATLKGELFPSGSLLGGTAPHVSLLETLAFQAGRSGNGVFAETSAFRTTFVEWWQNDPIWTYIAVGSTVAVVVAAVRHPTARLVAGLLIGYWAYLLRGGIVLSFYAIPLYALVGLALGVSAGLMLGQAMPAGLGLRRLIEFGRASVIAGLAVVVVTGFVIRHDEQRGQSLYTADQTRAQIEAVEWLLQRRDARTVAIDDHAFVDLNTRSGSSQLRADWYWKLGLDPQVQRESAGNSPDNIDYLVVTPQMNGDLPNLPFPLAAFHQSRLLKQFESDGWGVEIWANQSPDRILNATWSSYVHRFIRAGRVVDPQQGGVTTSEGQAYAMLRAVQMNDRATFDEVLAWSDTYLMTPTGLWGYKWTPATAEDATNGSLESSSASDADTDAALALILAARRWTEPSYAERARSLVESLWATSVASAGGQLYMTAGPWASQDEGLTINPSYLSPAAYREFAELDPAHDWMRVLDSSYAALHGCSSVNGLGLPPDWCAVDVKTGTYAESSPPRPRGPTYSFDAMRTSWRLALDWQWYGDPRDLAAGEIFRPLLERWKSGGELAAAYSHAGSVEQNFESAAVYGGNIGAFILLLNGAEASAVYEHGLHDQLYEDDTASYWQDPDNYYTQNWAWLGTALVSGKLDRFVR